MVFSPLAHIKLGPKAPTMPPWHAVCSAAFLAGTPDTSPYWAKFAEGWVPVKADYVC